MNAFTSPCRHRLGVFSFEPIRRNSSARENALAARLQILSIELPRGAIDQRSPMNRIFSAFCALLAFAASASAEIIGVETFDYPDGAIANQNGGTFWDFNNVAPGHTGTASNWDNVSNAPTVAGSQLITDNSRAKREYNGANEGQGAVNDANVNKAVYYRVTVTTGALPLPDFFGLSSYDLTNERIFIGKRFGQANFGVEISGGASNNSAIAVQANTTYTIVARIDYAANANTIRLYVNPDLNAGEPATPSTSVSFPKYRMEHRRAPRQRQYRLGRHVGQSRCRHHLG